MFDALPKDDLLILLSRTIRYVRSKEGAEHYGQPIGSIIGADRVLKIDKKAQKLGISAPQGALSAEPVDAQGAVIKPNADGSPIFKFNVNVSSLDGPKTFKVDGTPYFVPKGSKLYTASDGQLAFVLTPEGKIHAFNRVGEIEMNPMLGKALAAKFSAKGFTGDDDYSEAKLADAPPEDDTPDAVTPLADLKTGTVLEDKRGEAHFEKQAENSWTHLMLGVKVTDADIAPSYESGELVANESNATPTTSEPSAAATDSTPDLASMTPEEVTAWADAASVGTAVWAKDGTSGEPLKKRADGSWGIESLTYSFSSDNIAILKDSLVHENPGTGKAVDPAPVAPAKVSPVAPSDPAPATPATPAEVAPVAPTAPVVAPEAPAPFNPDSTPTTKPSVTGPDKITAADIKAMKMGDAVEYQSPNGQMYTATKKGANTWESSKGFEMDEAEMLDDAANGYLYPMQGSTTTPELVAPTPDPAAPSADAVAVSKLVDEAAIGTEVEFKHTNGTLVMRFNRESDLVWRKASSTAQVSHSAMVSEALTGKITIISVPTPEATAPDSPNKNLPEVTPQAPTAPQAPKAPKAESTPPAPETSVGTVPDPASKAAPEAKHSLIGDYGVKKIGAQAGSNPGGLYEIPTPDGLKKYYVKKAKTTQHGENEALANDLYRELGSKVPEVDFEADGWIYSKIVPGVHDMNQRLKDDDWMHAVRKDFVVDAWLSNRDVFGMTNDNILTDAENTPWRIDNGGALLYRAQGQAKTDFGPEVTELDAFRTGKKAKVYGPTMGMDEEMDGANRVLALTPARIKEMVAARNLPLDLAQTLIDRREHIAIYYDLTLPENKVSYMPDPEATQAADAKFDTLNTPEVPTPKAPEASAQDVVPATPDVPAAPATDTALQDITNLPEGAVEVKTLDPNAKIGTHILEAFANGGYVQYTKVGPGTWEEQLPGSNSTPYGYTQFKSYLESASSYKKFYTLAPKDQPTKVYAVGDEMPKDSPEAFAALPLGSSVTLGDSTYHHVSEKYWYSKGSYAENAIMAKFHTGGGKMVITELPTTDFPLVETLYLPGESISKFAHLKYFATGTEIKLGGSRIRMGEDGKWHQKDGGVVLDSTLADALVKGYLTYTFQPEPTDETSLDIQLYPAGKMFSKKDLLEAITAMEAHSGFQIAYGLKTVPNNPVADKAEQDRIKVAALKAFPEMKPKPAFVAYLKDKAGVESASPTEAVWDGVAQDGTPINLGSKSPVDGVQGFDGGSFTVSEVKSAVEILKAFDGKNFKSHLNLKGNPLGTLDPNALVGFNKDKIEGKKKVIALLEGKLAAHQKNIDQPVIRTPEEMIGFPIGTKVAYYPSPGSDSAFFSTWTKIGDDEWSDAAHGFKSPTSSLYDAQTFSDNGLRLLFKPEPKPEPVIPDYAQAPEAITSKNTSSLDAATFGSGDVEDAEIGTILKSVDGFKFYTQTEKGIWKSTQPSDPKHAGTGGDTWIKGLLDDGKIELMPSSGPEFNKSGLTPGKYVSSGASYMVVKADGSGVFVNSAGTVKSLTPAAVKKNHAAGMDKYAGIPATIPVPSTPNKTQKAKTVHEIADGSYFNADPSTGKASVYEVSGDTVTLFKPMLGTGSTVGSQPSWNFAETAGVGAAVSGTSDYKTGAWEKKADGLWHNTVPMQSYGDGNTVLLDPTASPYLYGLYVKSLGTKDPLVAKKSSTNTLFSQGKLMDQYGNSVLPEGYTGGVNFLGRITTIPALLKLQSDLKEIDVTGYTINGVGNILKDHNVSFSVPLTKKYATENVSNDMTAENYKTAFTQILDGLLAGVDTTPPESDSAQYFTFNELGNAKMPLEIASTPKPSYYDSSGLNAHIKMISSHFGAGKIIGQHYTSMDSSTKSLWVDHFKLGEFKEMYALEVTAAAKTNKPHKSGYLHPGYEGNEATNNIQWAAAVEGEISAQVDIDGEWSSPTVKWSLPEISNYLILAQMQNPTQLSNEDRREWVRQHKQGSKEQVDILSAKAALRTQNGDAPLGEPLVWTDDVKPAKSYDYLFDDYQFPSSQLWRNQSGYTPSDDWVADNLGNKNFTEWGAEYVKTQWPSNSASTLDQLASYHKENLVGAYFDHLEADYQEELLKPIYQKVKPITEGTHETWLVKDQFERQYIFKPHEDGKKYRTDNELAANQIGQLWGFGSAHAVVTNVEGEEGLVQNFIPSTSSFFAETGDVLDFGSLENKQLLGVANEHIFDWMLDNDDGHPANLLLKQDGSVVGIDKRRAFMAYGQWQGLSANTSSNTNAKVVYNHLYDGIKDGSIAPEDAAVVYFGALRTAKRLQKADPAAAEALVRQAVAGRDDWSVPDYMSHFDTSKAPKNADELVAAFLARKENLVADVTTMWEKVFSDAGLPVPEAPAKVLGSDNLSGWEEGDIFEKVTTAKVWGAAPLHANAGIVDGSSLIWKEENKDGLEVTKGAFRVGALTQTQVLSFLQSKAGTATGSTQPADPMYLSTFPQTNEWKSAISALGKDLTKHNVDLAFTPSTQETFDNVVGILDSDFAFWAPDVATDAQGYVTFPSGKKVQKAALPQYKLMLNHYKAQAEKVTSAKAGGLTTSKDDFSQYKALAPKSSPVIYSKGSETYTELANGKYLMQDGHLITVESLPDEVHEQKNGWVSSVQEEAPTASPITYSVTKAIAVSGKLLPGGKKVEEDVMDTKGHPGNEYTITLPTGEVITFRNSSSTGTTTSQHGMVKFRLADNTDPAMSLSNIKDQLEVMGLHMDGADETDAELQYWRAQFGRLILSNGTGATASAKAVQVKLQGMKSQLTNDMVFKYGPNNGGGVSAHTITEAIGMTMEQDAELAFWKNLANEAYGASKVAAFIDADRHKPQYQHMDLENPEAATGKPYFDRIDVDVLDLYKKGSMLAIGNHGKADSLLKYITSGGMLSTEERLRVLGINKVGASSSSDQDSGGANSVFTRVANGSAELTGSIYGQHVAYWSPAAMAHTGTYSYSSDTFGRLSALTSGNNTNPVNSLSYSSTGNETMVSNSLSIFDYLEIMVFEQHESTKRNEAIQRMKALGFATLRGLPIEERLVFRTDLKKTITKVKALWPSK